MQKSIISGAVENILNHWTNRLAVHVWDRLDLSESKMETLRHLLSFVYNKQTDDYDPIKIWVNPNDERDYLVMAKLASRPARKARRSSIRWPRSATSSSARTAAANAILSC
eukprot:7380090-Prymnesium_polylepis.1